jgi:hypothetical protein
VTGFLDYGTSQRRKKLLWPVVFTFNGPIYNNISKQQGCVAATFSCDSGCIASQNFNNELINTLVKVPFFDFMLFKVVKI